MKIQSSRICHCRSVRPDEIYNLAAQSHVAVSFQTPEYTAQTSGVGVLNVLEAARAAGLSNTVRFYQASTSELYGKVRTASRCASDRFVSWGRQHRPVTMCRQVHETPQTETTPFHPRSPYAVAKLYGFWIVKNYR